MPANAPSLPDATSGPDPSDPQATATPLASTGAAHGLEDHAFEHPKSTLVLLMAYVALIGVLWGYAYLLMLRHGS